MPPGKVTKYDFQKNKDVHTFVVHEVDIMINYFFLNSTDDRLFMISTDGTISCWITSTNVNKEKDLDDNVPQPEEFLGSIDQPSLIKDQKDYQLLVCYLTKDGDKLFVSDTDCRVMEYYIREKPKFIFELGRVFD